MHIFRDTGNIVYLLLIQIYNVPRLTPNSPDSLFVSVVNPFEEETFFKMLPFRWIYPHQILHKRYCTQ